MLSHAPTPDQTYTYRTEPLVWLRDELRVCGVDPIFIPDQIRPYVRLVARDGRELTVFLDTHAGIRSYKWTVTTAPTWHRVDDAGGAARRLLTWLRGGQ